MSSFDTRYQQEFTRRLIEIAQHRKRSLEEKLGDAHLGQAQPSDEQFVLWMAERLRLDPWFGASLQYDEGSVGQEMRQRFLALTGADPAMVPAPPLPPPMPVTAPGQPAAPQQEVA